MLFLGKIAQQTDNLFFLWLFALSALLLFL